MRNLVLFMHTSLDGFVAGPNGEMDWINVNDEVFQYPSQIIKAADTALYGRVTYQMMQAYWPTAADQPDPSWHDVEHSQWYNKVQKVVVSTTLGDAVISNTRVISRNIASEIKALKDADGKDIVIFGSPRVVHTLAAENLIDDYWLMVNPVVLGNGIPLFKGLTERIALTLETSQALSSGVICLQYKSKQ